MNKCNCNSCDIDKSKAMYSMDYDGLIEKLEETRSELDTVIKILKDRKEKDNIINTILSEEYEDDKVDEINVDDLLQTIKRMQRQQQPYTWKKPYTWYYYPWITF